MSISSRRLGCLLVVLASVLVVVSLGGPPGATAQSPKAEFKLKLMGINRALDPWKLYQDWAQVVEKRTSGRVQFELTSLPELGLGGAETIRVLKTGVVDVAEVYGGYVAGELPMVEILELPGIFPDGPTARKAIMAWKPTEAKILDQRANAVRRQRVTEGLVLNDAAHLCRVVEVELLKVPDHLVEWLGERGEVEDRPPLVVRVGEDELLGESCLARSRRAHDDVDRVLGNAAVEDLVEFAVAGREAPYLSSRVIGHVDLSGFVRFALPGALVPC